MKDFFRKIVASFSVAMLLSSMSIGLFGTQVAFAAGDDGTCDAGEISDFDISEGYNANDAANDDIVGDGEIMFDWSQNASDCDAVALDIDYSYDSGIWHNIGSTDHNAVEFYFDTTDLPDGDGDYEFRLKANGVVIDTTATYYIDNTAPEVDTVVTTDEDDDGHIDRITFEFDEDIDVASAPDVDGYAYVGGVTDNVVTLTLTEIADYDTGVTPEVTFGNVYDLAGNRLVDTTYTPDDAAGPVIDGDVLPETRDLDSDGHIDAIKVTFSEAIDDSSIDDIADEFILDSDDDEYADNAIYEFDATEDCEVGATVRTADTNYICLEFEEESADVEEGDTSMEGSNLDVQLVGDVELSDLSGNYAVDSTQNTSDGAGAVIMQALTVDQDSNGLLDALLVIFSEPIADSSVDISEFYLGGDYDDNELAFDDDNNCSGGLRAPDQDAICLEFDEEDLDDAGDTAETPTVSYMEDYDEEGTLEDANNGAVSYGHEQQSDTVDAAGPAIVAAETTSSTKTTVTFSEAIDDDSLAVEDFTLADFTEDDVNGNPTSFGDDDEDDEVVVLVHAGHGGNDTGTVALEDGEIDDLEGNASTQTAEFDIADGIESSINNSGGGGGGGGGSTIVYKNDNTSTNEDTTDEDTTDEEDSSTDFGDVDGHWAAEFVARLHDMGAVNGRTPTEFAPDASLTRAEMVKIALLTFGHEVDSSATASFSDVSADAWYAPYLAAAKDAGIAGGYADGSFHPDAPITRAEALKILLSAAGVNVAGSAAAPFADVDQGQWYAPFVNYAFANGIVSGKSDSTFAPEDFVTRAEMAKMAVKTYDAVK